MTEEGYKEGGLGAPLRHAIDWRRPAYTDAAAIDAELRRVFDICHGCRRCFNLCDTFPRLFDLIDGSDSGELDSVDSRDFSPVLDACTLCDLCFMTKCPYVPPHEFDLDFPHLVLRARAAAHKAGRTPFVVRQLARTDRNAMLAAPVAWLVNWAGRLSNWLTRPVLALVAGIHRAAALPRFYRRSLVARAAAAAPEVNTEAPAHGRKAVLYATCFANYNDPAVGEAARRILAANGVETVVEHPACCGMPLLEHGDIAAVAARADQVSAALLPWIDRGYDVVALVPSCALMLKFEWPLILPENENVRRLAEATLDITEYIVDIAKKEGLGVTLGPLDGGVTVHIPCHARAQNIGAKAAEMMRLIPDTPIDVIERCSGHGGSWGLMKENFEVALKVGRPVARTAAKKANPYLASECPLAGPHILQAMEGLDGDVPARAWHPVELFDKAMGGRGGQDGKTE